MVLITEKIKKLDKAVFKYAGKYRPKINPLNYKTIIADASKGKKIPDFEYEKVGTDHSEIIDYMKSIKVPKSIFQDLYKDKIEEFIKKMKLIDTTGTDNFSKVSKKLYGYPSKSLVKKAYTLLYLNKSPPEKVIDIKDAKKIMKHQLLALDINWKIYARKMLARASVRTEKSEITINSNYNFSENTIKRLAVHEIGTHAVRAMNAKLQPLRIFRNFPGYVKTEEGLAVFTEHTTGLLDNDSIRKYAGRVVAIDYAKNHNFKETYNYMCNYFDNATAAYITMRVKRGLPGPESLGAYTKDQVYLEGYFKIKEFAKKNPLKVLYYGKVNLKYIELLKKIEPELSDIKYFPPLIENFEIKKEFF